MNLYENQEHYRKYFKNSITLNNQIEILKNTKFGTK